MDCVSSSLAVKTSYLWIVGALATLSACSPTVTAPPRPAPTHAASAPACPLGLEGVIVTAVDTPDGIAVTFTSGDNLEDLRERTRRAAQMHGPFAKQGKGHDGRHGSGAHHGLQSFRLHDVRATTSEVPGGARIDFVPANPSDIATLRAELRARVETISRAPCQD